MARSRGPVGRLLLAPVLLLVLLGVGLHLVRAAAPHPAEPAPAVPDELPPVGGDPAAACRRGVDVPPPAAVRPPLPAEGRVTSRMVLACPEAFDGARVRYAGELVGDLLHRDGGAWVLVNDDAYALEVGPLPAHRAFRGANSGLAVWLPGELLDAVTGLGRPGIRGDVVELEGHLRRTDPADGDGLTLRADRMRVLAPSSSIEAAVHRPQAVLAAGAVAAAVALAIARRRGQWV